MRWHARFDNGKKQMCFGHHHAKYFCFVHHFPLRILAPIEGMKEMHQCQKNKAPTHMNTKAHAECCWSCGTSGRTPRSILELGIPSKGVGVDEDVCLHLYFVSCKFVEFDKLMWIRKGTIGCIRCTDDLHVLILESFNLLMLSSWNFQRMSGCITFAITHSFIIMEVSNPLFIMSSTQNMYKRS